MNKDPEADTTIFEHEWENFTGERSNPFYIHFEDLENIIDPATRNDFIVKKIRERLEPFKKSKDTFYIDVEVSPASEVYAKRTAKCVCHYEYRPGWGKYVLMIQPITVEVDETLGEYTRRMVEHDHPLINTMELLDKLKQAIA